MGATKEDEGEDLAAEAQPEHGVGQGAVVVKPAYLRSTTEGLPHQAGLVYEESEDDGRWGASWRVNECDLKN